MNKIILLLSLFMILTACNSKKKSDDTATDADLNQAYCTLNLCPSGIPTGLNYAGVNQLTLTKDVALSEMTPTFTPNFYLYTFRVNPQLPTGLVLDSSTGKISGTPLVASAERTYKIVLDNRLIGEETIIAGGLAVYDLKISVTERIPKQFDYLARDSKAQYQSLKGQNDSIPRPAAISNLIIDRNVNMEPLEFSSHDLGQLSCVVNTNGTVRAITTTEFAGLNNSMTCRKKASNIECKNSYFATNTLDCVRNEPSMTIDLDTVSFVNVYCDKYSASKMLDCSELGRSPTNYSINPSLPSGLVLNPADGRISGAPLSEQLAQTYRITVSNTGGSKFYDLSITIRGDAPADLSYLFPIASYKAGLDIVANNPIYSGDTANSYSITPLLPNGLSFNTTTGFISGNPGQIVNNNSYTITAQNIWGSTSTTVNISVIDNITDISVGQFHSCAVRNKLVSCWGKNDKGQLGYEGSQSCAGVECSLKAVNVRKDNFTLEAKKVATSTNTSCTIQTDNKVSCWGDNSLGQLGTDSADNMSREPQLVDIDSDDNNLINVKKIVAGTNHFCALTTEGNVWCWGSNVSGQISVTGLTSALFAFQTVNSTGVGFLSNIKDISAGFDHNCAISQDDKVYCWGLNDAGQFGNGTTAPSTLPTKMLESLAIDFIGAKRIFAGSNFNLIEKNDNLLYSVGNNDYHQLASGLGSTVFPRLTQSSDSDISPLSSLISVKTGLNSFCFLKNNLASCLGQNNGDFGVSNPLSFSQNPVVVRNEDDSANLENIDVLSNGFGSHRCVSIIGVAYCFGDNTYGQLGNNSQTSSLLPVPVNFN